MWDDRPRLSACLLMIMQKWDLRASISDNRVRCEDYQKELTPCLALTASCMQICQPVSANQLPGVVVNTESGHEEAQTQVEFENRKVKLIASTAASEWASRMKISGEYWTFDMYPITETTSKGEYEFNYIRRNQIDEMAAVAYRGMWRVHMNNNAREDGEDRRERDAM